MPGEAVAGKGRLMRIRGVRRKIYLLTYDKKRLNQRALRIRRSFDECGKYWSGSERTSCRIHL